jgi:hypothetical protein
MGVGMMWLGLQQRRIARRCVGHGATPMQRQRFLEQVARLLRHLGRLAHPAIKKLLFVVPVY